MIPISSSESYLSRVLITITLLVVSLCCLILNSGFSRSFLNCSLNIFSEILGLLSIAF